jgi:hypothetical protein
MKKSLLVIAGCFFAVFAVVFMTAGSYTADTLNNVNKIKSNTSGLTIDSKGVVDVNATGAVSVESSGSTVTIGDSDGSTLAAGGTFYHMVSATATGGGLSVGNRILFGNSAAKAAGLNVTITAGASFTGTSTYWVIATQEGTAAATAPVVVKKVSGSVFTIYADDSSTITWMAIGH